MFVQVKAFYYANNHRIFEKKQKSMDFLQLRHYMPDFVSIITLILFHFLKQKAVKRHNLDPDTVFFYIFLFVYCQNNKSLRFTE